MSGSFDDSFDIDPYELMILDLKQGNGQVKQDEILNTCIGNLLSANIYFEDIIVLMISLDKTSEMLDLEMDHLKNHYEKTMYFYEKIKGKS